MPREENIKKVLRDSRSTACQAPVVRQLLVVQNRKGLFHTGLTPHSEQKPQCAISFWQCTDGLQRDMHLLSPKEKCTHIITTPLYQLKLWREYIQPCLADFSRNDEMQKLAGQTHIPVFLMMRPWSIFCPIPWTTKTTWVVWGGLSSGVASSTKPRWSRVPLLEAASVKGYTESCPAITFLSTFALLNLYFICKSCV